MYCVQGRYQEAEPLFLRSLKITEQSLGATNRGAANVLSDYALLLPNMHRKDEAHTLEARVRVLQASCDSEDPATFQNYALLLSAYSFARITEYVADRIRAEEYITQTFVINVIGDILDV